MSMARSLKSPKIHLWMPELSRGKGGIQVFSSLLLKALISLLPQVQLDVFAKNDIASPTHLSANLSDTKITFHYVGGWSPALRTPAFLAQLNKAVLLDRPDLIISTHTNFSLAAYWLKKIYRVPYWLVAHGIEVWDAKQGMARDALAYADRILAVSNYTRERLISAQSLNPAQVTVLPNTFESSHFRIAAKPERLLARYQLKPEQPLILTVSRLAKNEQYKGYDQIIKALPSIKQQIPDVHYMIVGKGDDKERIEQLIAEQGLQKSVTLTGFVPDEEIADYYNLCDLFAMPSTGEGFGIVFLEALASGKPVLAGNKDGSVDALCQGELGILIDPESIAQIADAIIMVLSGKCTNRLIYQPEMLRQKVIETFGLERFKSLLGEYIKSFPTLS